MNSSQTSSTSNQQGGGALETFRKNGGVSKNRGGPPKWMVKTMENPIEMDDLGYPYFWKHLNGVFHGGPYK